MKGKKFIDDQDFDDDKVYENEYMKKNLFIDNNQLRYCFTSIFFM